MNETERAHWLAERAGKLTASRMADAMAVKKDGTPTEARANLMRDLLAERLTGLTVRHFVTPAMEHGLICEDEAWRAYEASTGNFAQPSRFYEHPTIENFGCTPDREIDADGLGESKCPTTSTFVDWCLKGEVPAKHKPQMLAQLACTGRKWVEFVAYDPRIKSPEGRLFVRRFEPKPEEIEQVEEAARTFLAELDELFFQLTTKAA
jgi:predicted phage-related endonuclease